ncbi:MAG: prepilin-type N-terminal cleavage/methylation domain-containing protein [Proteocatella sp.]
MKKLNDKGISLIEVLCSGAILAIVSLIVTTGFISNLEVYRKGSQNYKDVNSYINEIENKTAFIDDSSSPYININGVNVAGKYRYTKDSEGNITMAEFVPNKEGKEEKPIFKDYIAVYKLNGIDETGIGKPSTHAGNWTVLKGQGNTYDPYVNISGFAINGKFWETERLVSRNTEEGEVFIQSGEAYFVMNSQWIQYNEKRDLNSFPGLQKIRTDARVLKDENYIYSSYYGTYYWVPTIIQGDIYIPN